MFLVLTLLAALCGSVKGWWEILSREPKVIVLLFAVSIV